MSLSSMTNEAALRFSLHAIVTLYEEAADPRTSDENMLRQVDFVSERTALVQALAPVTSRCLGWRGRGFTTTWQG